MSSGSGFEDALRRFLDHFEEISNCADEDVFLKEFMVSDRMCSSEFVCVLGVHPTPIELTNHLHTLCQKAYCARVTTVFGSMCEHFGVGLVCDKM